MKTQPIPTVGNSNLIRAFVLLISVSLVYAWMTSSFEGKLEIQKFTRCPADLDLPKNSPVPGNREKLRRNLDGLDLVLLGSAPNFVAFPGSDMELSGWRQTSNILYVLGRYNIAKSFVLINSTGPEMELSVFLPDLKQKEIVFNGDVPDLNDILKQFNVHHVYSILQLPAVLGKQKIDSPDTNILDLLPKNVTEQIKENGGSVAYSIEAEQAFVTARFSKSQQELDYLRYAGKVAYLSHKLVGQAIEDGFWISESSLASFFVHISTICRCRLQAYSPIVGAGRHAGVLHFPTGQDAEAGYGKVSATDFILIDAAGAYDGYASDLTRTYTTKSSEKYKELHKIVEKSQHAGLAAHVKGNTVFIDN